jgi:hypothetical protein
LQVQVPEKSGITSPSGLVGKRIVTSFENLGGDYFKEVDAQKGIQPDSEGSTKIEYVGGSVEAACALGLADGIGGCFAYFLVLFVPFSLFLLVLLWTFATCPFLHLSLPTCISLLEC